MKPIGATKRLWENVAIWRVLKMIRVTATFSELHTEADAIQADFNVAEFQGDNSR
jgi:hypothetical protein